MNHKTRKTLGACITWCVLFVVTAPPAPASPLKASEQRILSQLKLDQRFHLQHMIVQSQYAYILVTTEERQQTALGLRLAWCRNGKWISAGGSEVKLPGNNIKELKYSLSGRSGHHGGVHYEFAWSLYGYTTDPTVASFRIKTKTGYLPLAGINQRYFLRILTDAEAHNFVEVQGLNSKGEVVQRDNGVAKNKPRQWSPKHSEVY